jgi:hypothetical protein
MTAPAPPMMTAERWRAVDQILQGALTCTREHRDAFVEQSCGDDAALRTEVSSLLAAYDSTPGEFLERPAIEEGSPIAPTPPIVSRRTVSARFVVYAAAASILLGTVTGWTLAKSPTVERWRETWRVIRQQASANTAPVVPGAAGELALVIMDRAGQVVRQIPGNRPTSPRFAPDGRRLAYGALGDGRTTSDIWTTAVDGGPARRVTNDDADNTSPQWSPDGATLAYALRAGTGRRIAERWASGGGARVLSSQPGSQFPTDWAHDGSVLLVSADDGHDRSDILVQPADGSATRPYAATSARETAGRLSPHTHWVAYMSSESGRDEVYVDAYPRPGFRVMVSQGGGVDPAWRGDGRELYYWRGDALIAVPIDGSRGGRPPILGDERVLFHSAYEHSVISMYDVSPDGQRIAVVRRSR